MAEHLNPNPHWNDFVAFLKEKDIYEEFFKEMYDRHGNSSPIGIVLFRTAPEDFINYTLSWSLTEKGHDYWAGIHQEWRERIGQ